MVYVLPGVGISGGVAVVLQHANRLIQKGYDVSLLSLDENGTSINWFPGNKAPVFTLSNKDELFLTPIDILIATHFSTTKVVEKMPAKRRIYFVQSDERRFDLNIKEFRKCEKSYKLNFEYMTEAVWIQKWLKEEFNYDAYYVPNGLDQKIFYKTDPLKKRGGKARVLLEGPINFAFKGVKDAYEAVKDLDCEIWIISSHGRPKKNWKYDRFFESVSMTDMKKIYSSCDVFLKMSRVEGFFGPPLEAMACGCLVVVGKCTGYDEYIKNGENALVVNMGDIESAKQATQKLIDDKELRKKLIKNGCETAGKWSWDRSVNMLEKVINKEPIEKYYLDDFPEKYDYNFTMRSALLGVATRQGKQVEYLENAVNNQNEEINNANKIIQQKDQELNFIKSSKFWKAREKYVNMKLVIQDLFLVKILKKAVYLLKSFWYSLKREGFANSLIRFFYYIKYGKGVTSKKDYEMFIKAKRSSLEHLSDIVETIKKDGVLDFELKAGDKIDIIIPAYNGLEYLKPLFDSIFKNTKIFYRLIIIDDCSSDINVYKFLKKIKKENSDKNIKLIRNEKNLGFVKTVNKAVKFTKNHFVVLNTDTEVPEEWLGRLMRPIFKSDKISSVTPFTNAGTIYSFPNFLDNNEIFENLRVDEIDKYFRKINIGKEITTPTGMGFCMGFNKHTVNKIGMFDESSFGKGYGEENDWCVRAEKEGYKNIIAPNLFIYHKHGGSFSDEERKKLLEKNLVALNKKHPGYDKKIQSFIKKDPLKKIRDLLIVLISAGFEKNNKPILFFDHELGGGANIYREKFIEKIVKNGKKALVLSYDMRSNVYYLKYFYKNYKIGYTLENIEELSELLEFIKLEEIILSQIVSYEKPLEMLAYIQDIKRKQNCRLKFLLHDYFCVCPSYNLLNQDGKYCNIPRLDICKKCLNTNKGQFKMYTSNKDIELWRRGWKKFLDTADEIVCFSEYSKNVIKKAYADLDDEKIKIIPHKLNYIKNKAIITSGKDGSEVFNIGVLGGIDPAKGSKIIREIIEIINKDNLKIKIVIIGQLAGNIKSNKLIVTGKYKQEEIESLVEKYKIDAFLIPSVWPETFSYTAEEIMQMRMPLAVFNLGAPAERVKKYEKGKIISEISAKSALDALLKMKTQIL